jgi:hypothetical protein
MHRNAGQRIPPYSPPGDLPDLADDLEFIIDRDGPLAVFPLVRKLAEIGRTHGFRNQVRECLSADPRFESFRPPEGYPVLWRRGKV